MMQGKWPKMQGKDKRCEYSINIGRREDENRKSDNQLPGVPPPVICMTEENVKVSEIFE